LPQKTFLKASRSFANSLRDYSRLQWFARGSVLGDCISRCSVSRLRPCLRYIPPIHSQPSDPSLTPSPNSELPTITIANLSKIQPEGGGHPPPNLTKLHQKTTSTTVDSGEGQTPQPTVLPANHSTVYCLLFSSPLARHEQL
jgi:hypothetical protein